MQQKIKPLPGYCLIEPSEDEQKSAGGVYLPESTKDKPSKGKVLAVGDAIRSHVDIEGNEYFKLAHDIEPPIKEGDIVVYKKWVSQEVQHEGKELLLVHFNELLAVIE